MNDIIICRICKKEFVKQQYLTHHLKSTHKIDCSQYIKDNFEDFIRFGWKKCVECGSPFKERSNKCGKCYTKNHQIKKDQYIQCHYCDKSIHSKMISIHLKIYHNIKFLNYVKTHLEEFKRFNWAECIICKNICKSYTNRPTCSTKCSSELRKTWVGEESIRFGAVLSDETKEKISKSNIGIKKPMISGKLNPACRKEVREQISKTRIERGVAKGEKNGMFGKTHTSEAIKNIMSHRPMNKLEKIVADELDKVGIPYYFQYFITENGICKSYDFKIKEKNIILEVDGDFWHGNPNTKSHHININKTVLNDKLKDEMALKRGIKVIRLWESCIKKDPTIILRSISPYIY